MFSLVLNEGIAPRVPTRGQYRKGKNAAEPALSPVFSRSLARLSSLGVSVSPVVAALFLWSPSFLEPSIGNYLCMYVPPSPVQVKTKRFLCDLLIKCVHASWRMTREFQSSPFSITFAWKSSLNSLTRDRCNWLSGNLRIFNYCSCFAFIVIFPWRGYKAWNSRLLNSEQYCMTASFFHINFGFWCEPRLVWNDIWGMSMNVESLRGLLAFLLRCRILLRTFWCTDGCCDTFD